MNAQARETADPSVAPIESGPAAAGRILLLRMLLISAALHAAMVFVVQPRAFPPVSPDVIIEARLEEGPDETAAPAATEPPPDPSSDPVRPEPTPPPPSLSEPPKAELPPPAPVPETKPEPRPPVPAAAPVAKPSPAPTPVETVAPSALPSVPVMVDTNWYSAKQLDVQPRAAVPINPRYPPGAQRDGIQGSVKLKLRIDEFGIVREVDVEEGDPPGVFDASALEAFRVGRFVPARKDGRTVRAQIHIRVRYELND